jgi:AbrB family looped-hinge helix DNA binding protein
MTIVRMSEKGQIVVPKHIREKRGFANGSAFAVMETQSGQIVLRPVKTKPTMSLVECLRKFKGIDIPEVKAHCPPRVGC